MAVRPPICIVPHYREALPVMSRVSGVIPDHTQIRRDFDKKPPEPP
jgi:hypothetical protein